MTRADASEIKSWLGKVTTAGDGVGRVKRDLDLLVALNPHWPDSVKSPFAVQRIRLTSMAQEINTIMATMAEVVASEAPEE